MTIPTFPMKLTSAEHNLIISGASGAGQRRCRQALLVQEGIQQQWSIEARHAWRVDDAADDEHAQ